LLEKLNNPGTCKLCPRDVAICFGGSNIGPLPGYWRKSNYTEVFVKCINSKACLGIKPPNFNP
jgi:hypothetical protein